MSQYTSRFGQETAGIPNWPLFPTTLDLERLAEEFALRLSQDTSDAFDYWRSALRFLPKDLHGTLTLANKGLGSYDDKIAVLNSSGRPRSISVFPACTEPGAQYSQRASFKDIEDKSKGRHDPRYAGVSYRKSDGIDINKDGIKDAGRLLEGTYAYFEMPGGFLGARAFRVRTTQIAERDTNGDGRFDLHDRSRIDKQGAGTSMYIHRGGADQVSNPNTWSAGCQTIPKNHFDRFLSNIPLNSSFYYVLVNAR